MTIDLHKRLDDFRRRRRFRQGTQYAIKALYTLFAKDAAYVTYQNPALDRSAQNPESSAPLNMATVRAELQNALRRAVLTAIKSYTGLHDDFCYLSPL